MSPILGVNGEGGCRIVALALYNWELSTCCTAVTLAATAWDAQVASNSGVGVRDPNGYHCAAHPKERQTVAVPLTRGRLILAGRFILEDGVQ
jgi:hypothetical protein